MKKTLLLLFAGIFAIETAQAQDAATKQDVAPPVNTKHNVTPAEMSGNPGASRYYYRVFTAPDNTKGYDIFKNGRLIFHQPSPGGSAAAFTQRAALKGMQLKPAEAQAQLSIEKVKRGLSPVLTDPEKLAAVKNPAN